jgi:hypothetical protein
MSRVIQSYGQEMGKQVPNKDRKEAQAKNPHKSSSKKKSKKMSY